MEEVPSPERRLGEHYLGLLGMGALAGVPVSVRGRSMEAGDFLTVCAEHALPPLVGFENLPDGHGDKEPTRQLLRRQIGRLMGLDEEGLTQAIAEAEQR